MLQAASLLFLGYHLTPDEIHGLLTLAVYAALLTAPVAEICATL